MNLLLRLAAEYFKALVLHYGVDDAQALFVFEGEAWEKLESSVDELRAQDRFEDI